MKIKEEILEQYTRVDREVKLDLSFQKALAERIETLITDVIVKIQLYLSLHSKGCDEFDVSIILENFISILDLPFKFGVGELRVQVGRMAPIQNKVVALLKMRLIDDATQGGFSALEKENNIVYIDMPEDIREKYQYFTEATMLKLKHAGYTEPFTSLEEGVTDYVRKYLIEEKYC